MDKTQLYLVIKKLVSCYPDITCVKSVIIEQHTPQAGKEF